MKTISERCIVIAHCVILAVLPIPQLYADTGFFHMPNSNNKTIYIHINQDDIKYIYYYHHLVEWCEIERNSDLSSRIFELDLVRDCGRDFIEAYNNHTLDPHLLWMTLKQYPFREYLWMIVRNQLPIVQKEWKYLSVFPKWKDCNRWLPVLIIPFNTEPCF